MSPDQIFLLRKAKEPGQRLIILTKGRYKEEGSYGTSLISINSNQEKTEITIDLVEEDVDESEYAYNGSNNKSYPAEMILKAQERYALGESARKIGKDLGVHHSTVARWIKKAS